MRVCHNAATDKRLHLSLLLISCLATPQTPREAGTQTCHNIHQVKYTAAVAVEATWESRCWRESKILTRKQAAGLGATRSLDVLACKIVISRAVGRSSGGASGSWVTSTHVPGRSLRASPAVVQPGRTAACTSRTDNGAYLTGNKFQDIAGMYRKIEGGGWFIGGTRERVWAGVYRRGVARPRAVRLLRLSPLATKILQLPCVYRSEAGGGGEARRRATNHKVKDTTASTRYCVGQGCQSSDCALHQKYQRCREHPEHSKRKQRIHLFEQPTRKRRRRCRPGSGRPPRRSPASALSAATARVTPCPPSPPTPSPAS